MAQLDLFTGRESASAVPETIYIPTINFPSDLETFLNDLNVVPVGVHFLGSAIQKRSLSSNYRGLCPFHSERTPSFYLKPRANYFICYGCHEVGGPLTLWARLDGRLRDDLLEKLVGEKIDIFNTLGVSHLSQKRRQYYNLFQEAVEREYLATVKREYLAAERFC